MKLVRRLAVAAAVVCLGLVAHSQEAHAQYKNVSWGLYAGSGFWLPSGNSNFYVEQATINQLGQLPTGETSPNGLPYALITPMVHLEVNFKISQDFHWWFKSGLDFGFVSVGEQRAFDQRAQGGLGLLLELVAGPRVYFATDNIRPYLEIGARVPIPGLIILSSSNELLAQNLKTFPGVYGNLGLEFIVARDVALSLVAGYTRFILINAPGFNSIDAKLGVLFYM